MAGERDISGFNYLGGWVVGLTDTLSAHLGYQAYCVWKTIAAAHIMTKHGAQRKQAGEAVVPY